MNLAIQALETIPGHSSSRKTAVKKELFRKALVAVTIILCVWMFRYTIVPAGVGGQQGNVFEYCLDRWTGKVSFIGGGYCRDVKYIGNFE